MMVARSDWTFLRRQGTSDSGRSAPRPASDDRSAAAVGSKCVLVLDTALMGVPASAFSVALSCGVGIATLRKKIGENSVDNLWKHVTSCILCVIDYKRNTYYSK
jgi:hypothetical protein